MNEIPCPNCGHMNRAGAKFCIKCRAQLAAASPPPPQQPAQQQPPPMFVPPMATTAVSPSATRNRWLWAGAGVVLLLLIAIAAILFWPQDEEETAVTDATPTAEVEDSEENDEAEESGIDEESADETVEEEPTPEEEPTAVVEEETLPTPEAVETPMPQSTPVANLLTNGNFEESWEAGWRRTLGPNATGEGRIEVIPIDRGITGQGIHITRTGPDFLQLAQTVSVDPTNLHFTAQLQLASLTGEAEGVEGMGVLMLIYRDAEQQPIGYSIWANESARNSQLFGIDPLPPVGNSVSRRWVGDDWQEIEQDLRQEIINSLPTINPDNVSAITVALLAIGSGECPPDACAVDIQATDLILSFSSAAAEE